MGRAWGQAAVERPGWAARARVRANAAKHAGPKAKRAGLKESWRLSGTEPRVDPYAAILAPVYTATGRALDILDSVAERALAVQ